MFVTEDEVNQRINELAGRYQKWPNEIKKYYEDNNLMGQLRGELREEKVRKLLREKAVITEERAASGRGGKAKGQGAQEGRRKERLIYELFDANCYRKDRQG